jgi:hypothetical protein
VVRVNVELATGKARNQPYVHVCEHHTGAADRVIREDKVVERTASGLPQFRIRWLMSWLVAVVVAGALGSVAVRAPAFAARSGGTYQPHCYDTLCLGQQSAPAYSLLAWSRYDVGPTPYYISIFDTHSGERLAVCGQGTSCQASMFGALTVELSGCLYFVAYIGGLSASMPPAPVLQTSATFRWCQPGG